ncbi:MAG: helix-turn-helix transcriptional regulator [Verrucomicrobiota bacterium]|nr:helix-turn-helix transcriptional regulator [Verrucomicrobiota bacterium]
MQQSLGEKIKELRLKLDLPLRELARRIKISAPFLSDIELGRRLPSEEVLRALAKELRVAYEELSKLDVRTPLSDLKQMAHENPSWALAFRKVAEQGKGGKLTPEDMIRKLTERKDKK